ncbi:MAG: 16S rRNA (uracil(1498)-N(3))-methyltransferase [Spirochaetales bacterium]|nr:16S rRNA (uracil(1498)-N(3))-methyltransferase [Spirochaetales bacterium]
MKKIFLPYNIAAFTASSTLTVIGEDHNHIANSLRAKIGEHFIVGDTDGHELSCTIAQITKREVIFSVDAPFIRQNCASNELILIFALLKGDKNEEILKRCTEIGVSRFIPIVTHNCVMKVDDKSAAAKQSRWQQIVREASMQSGRQYIPKVEPIMTMAQLCQINLPECRYFGQILSNLPIGDILPKNIGESAAVCIGPEGDFTTDEEKMLSDSGWIGVACPTNVMRSETAAIYFASILSFFQNGINK